MIKEGDYIIIDNWRTPMLKYQGTLQDDRENRIVKNSIVLRFKQANTMDEREEHIEIQFEVSDGGSAFIPARRMEEFDISYGERCHTHAELERIAKQGHVVLKKKAVEKRISPIALALCVIVPCLVLLNAVYVAALATAGTATTWLYTTPMRFVWGLIAAQVSTVAVLFWSTHYPYKPFKNERIDWETFMREWTAWQSIISKQKQ